jgi:hypothetical protein
MTDPFVPESRRGTRSSMRIIRPPERTAGIWARKDLTVNFTLTKPHDVRDACDNLKWERLCMSLLR